MSDYLCDLSNEILRIGDADIHYRTCGTGDPLLILHGGGDGSTAWIPHARQLSKTYTVYIPDMPGFGQSQSKSNTFDIDDFVSFIEDFTYGLGIDRFYLIGHSIGGAIALHYAFRSPQRVIKLVLVSSFCLGKEVALWVRVLSSTILRKSLGEPTVILMEAIKWLSGLFWDPFKFRSLLLYAR